MTTWHAIQQQISISFIYFRLTVSRPNMPTWPANSLAISCSASSSCCCCSFRACSPPEEVGFSCARQSTRSWKINVHQSQPVQPNSSTISSIIQAMNVQQPLRWWLQRTTKSNNNNKLESIRRSYSLYYIHNQLLLFTSDCLQSDSWSSSQLSFADSASNSWDQPEATCCSCANDDPDGDATTLHFARRLSLPATAATNTKILTPPRDCPKSPHRLASS